MSNDQPTRCRRVHSQGQGAVGVLELPPSPPLAKNETFTRKRPNIARVPPRPASEDPSEPLSGPSETTSAELKALKTFRENNTEGVPHLIAHKCELQGLQGPFPNGYISYSVMTKMPGQDLMALKFWSLEEEEREQRRQAFLEVLKYVSPLSVHGLQTTNHFT